LTPFPAVSVKIVSGRSSAKECGVRAKIAEVEAGAVRPKKGRARKLLCLAVVGVLVGYYLGFHLDEEKRGRVAKLMYEGREMWFRIFV
jgi:hypothetical protein